MITPLLLEIRCGKILLAIPHLILYVHKRALGTACRFVDVLAVMKNAMPGTHIIIQGLLPRGADFGAGRYDYPNNYTAAENILNAEYQVAYVNIGSLCRGKVNDAVKCAVKRQLPWLQCLTVVVWQRITLQDPYLHYIYCGAGFITDTADGIAPVSIIVICHHFHESVGCGQCAE